MAASGEPEINKPLFVVPQSPFTRVRQEVYDFGNGPTIREVVERPDAVVVMVMQGPYVYFVTQHRYGAGKPLVEFPAGKIDKDAEGKDDLAKAFYTARKELQEEIGFDAEYIQHLGGFYSSPGYVTEYLYAFFATDLIPSKLEGDEEDLTVTKIPYKDVAGMIRAGTIQDAKSIATLMLYRLSKEPSSE